MKNVKEWLFENPPSRPDNREGREEREEWVLKSLLHVLHDLHGFPRLAPKRAPRLQSMPGMEKEASPVAHAVIGCAIEVHRELGPGLLESAYSHCLAYELSQRGIPFLREYQLPIRYKDTLVDCGYRIDFVVDNSLLLEVKSVDALSAVHQAQVLTYLKLSGIQHGLLINFNARLVKDGIKSLLLRRAPAHETWANQHQDGQP